MIVNPPTTQHSSTTVKPTKRQSWWELFQRKQRQEKDGKWLPGDKDCEIPKKKSKKCHQEFIFFKLKNFWNSFIL